MTQTLPGADIRGYYIALGIQVPAWAKTEASIRCFADPDAHRREDRDPSCSVNLEHGAWHCHACGASGGAYDAAIARGYTAREAIDLMVAHQLTEHRAGHRRRRPRPTQLRAADRSAAYRRRTGVSASERDITSWHVALLRDRARLQQLARTRRWSVETVRELRLGLHRGRITIPICDRVARLQGVLLYRPEHDDAVPKMIAVPGTRLGLIPHPGQEPARQIFLTEGPPDMIAGRSFGLPAIAVPGDHAWQAEWAGLFAGCEVTIIIHSDAQGRAAGRRTAADLRPVADRVTLVDLALGRNDGYDLTDWLLEGGQPEALRP